jgi:integrase
MKIKFYLRKPTEDVISAIYASICYHRNRLIVFPGESTHRRDWNFDENRPKASSKNATLEGRLFKAEQLYRDTYDELKIIHGKKVPTNIYKTAIDEKNNPELTKIEEPILILDFFQKLIDDSKSGRRKTIDNMEYDEDSIKPYKSAMEHFRKFSKRKKYYLTDIDQTLIDNFTNYLNSFLALNTSAKYLTVLKTLISYATQKKLISINVSLENKVRVRKAVADNIYLNEDEIKGIMEIKDNDLPTKLYRTVRDLFVIGCNTGLRFQDYSILKAASIRDGFLEIDPQKLEKKYYLTTKVVIPVLPMVEEVFKRYPKGLPKSPCNQVFNNCLKEIAKKIPSLNKDYEKKLIKGHKVERIKLKKYDMVVTHTARRSYCTNMYLRRVPIPTIMAISGHKTEENFLKYIKADNRKHAEILKAMFDEGEKKKAEILKKQLKDGNKGNNKKNG